MDRAFASPRCAPCSTGVSATDELGSARLGAVVRSVTSAGGAALRVAGVLPVAAGAVPVCAGTEPVVAVEPGEEEAEREEERSRRLVPVSEDLAASGVVVGSVSGSVSASRSSSSSSSSPSSSEP